MLIDGNAIIHRAFHALPPLTTKSGELINAVYGFTMILLKAIKDIDPTYCAVAFDLATPTFRHEIYKEYKATRVKADQGLYDQIPRIKQIVETLNIPIFQKEGFEADDIIGTLATQATEKNIETIIVTGDLDTLQLVNHISKVYTMRKGFTDTVIYDAQAVQDRYGLTPEQFIDFKALRGDSSDNIPGIPGIGEKGATSLLQQYGTMEGILSHLNELPDRIKQAFEDNRDRLKLNKKLVSIVCDIPIQLQLKQCMIDDYDRAKAVELFQELEFKSLLPRLPESRTPSQKTTQGELFAKNTSEPQRVKSSEFQEHIITDESKLIALIDKLEKSSHLVVDTEQDYLNNNLIGISLASDNDDAYYIPMNHINCGKLRCLTQDYILKHLKPLLENPEIQKIGHNIKYDYTNLQKYDICLNPIYFDTMIASYILNPASRSHSLDTVSFVELGFEKIPLTDLIGERKQGNLAEAPLDQVARYSAEDAHCTFRLWQKLSPQLADRQLKKLFYELDMPLVKILADMEIAGVKIDINYLSKLQKELRKRLVQLEKLIYSQTGTTFNIASPRQLADVLFNVLKLSSAEIKKGKTGISTAAGELEKLLGTHPVIDSILEFRELTKLLNTYIEALPKIVGSDGRLHTSFNQTITTTGRLSSSEPNLQNIPIRTELGQEIRRAFIAEKGFKLLSADYSQIELRVMAHLSKDEAMIEAFRAGRDIHEETSNRLGIDRRMAKVVNFSIIYGTSPYGLAQALEIDQHEAKALIDHYFTTYPGVKKYMIDTVAKAKQDGFVETLFGRKRYIPEIYSASAVVRNSAERAAINMPIQGTGADIVKLAMIDVEKYIELSDSVRLLLQVHDELVLEVPEDKISPVAKDLKKIMESAYILEVPLVVKIEEGLNWADLKLVQ
ncbi:MAG: DNA polymerase I [bacterium]|nr:DNA polymerase I [bacterium]